MKKNIKKIPENLIRKIQTFTSDNLRVECVLRVSKDAIRNGEFATKGISLTDNNLRIEEGILPNSRFGRFSRKNINGYVIIYRDRPKVSKSWDIEVPNFGDWAKGSHIITFTREVYQRKYVSPRFNTIKIEVLNEEIGRDAYIIKFSVEEVLNRLDPNFLEDLFFNLNLLQEFIGSIDVYEATTSKDDYLRTLFVDWEIFPIEETDRTIELIIGRSPSLTRREINEIRERIELFKSLGAVRFISGTSGFARYYGAKFKEDLVVFENDKYGNASYIMFTDWEELSKRSRYDLLTSKDSDFIRVIHNRNWENKLTAIINKYMGRA